MKSAVEMVEELAERLVETSETMSGQASAEVSA